MKFHFVLLLIFVAGCSSTPKHERWIAEGVTVEVLCGYLQNVPPLADWQVSAKRRRNENAKKALRVIAGSESACEPIFNAATKEKFKLCSDKSLCIQHMSYRKEDSAQVDIRREIKRRALDCWQYGDVAAAHRKLELEAARHAAELAAIKAEAKKEKSSQSRSSSRKSRPTSGFPPLNVFLEKSVPIIGGVKCYYSNGEVRVVRDTGYCPR